MACCCGISCSKCPPPPPAQIDWNISIAQGDTIFARECKCDSGLTYTGSAVMVAANELFNGVQTPIYRYQDDEVEIALFGYDCNTKMPFMLLSFRVHWRSTGTFDYDCRFPVQIPCTKTKQTLAGAFNVSRQNDGSEQAIPGAAASDPTFYCFSGTKTFNFILGAGQGSLNIGTYTLTFL